MTGQGIARRGARGDQAQGCVGKREEAAIVAGGVDAGYQKEMHKWRNLVRSGIFWSPQNLFIYRPTGAAL
ncbi:hypothetical protein F183_A43350 [Bryobacterales bacterium F-183]|nr:hypothetical protein F183_A43350 [Bryobacterales bacterium F-183]